MSFAEPGAKPHYPPSRFVRIRRATIRLTVDPEARSFSGQAELELEALPTYAGEFSVDLDDVEVDHVAGDGASVRWAHRDGKVVVQAEAAPSVLTVRWHGQDPVRGLFFVGPTEAEPERAPMAWTQCQDEDGHFVFPCHDHPSVKHPWTLELTAPAGYTLLSNGRAVETVDLGEQVRATYEQTEPMPAYLVTFVAARLSVVSASHAGKAVRYFVPEGAERNVERAFGRTPAMIEHFGQRLGVAYPWPRYDQVVVNDFIFGGMENVACTTMTDLILVDAKAELEWAPDSLVAHELAHQWFGDLVTCRDWSQGWLNESWATYMEAVWWEKSRPAVEATLYRFHTAQKYHHEHDHRYARPIVTYDFKEPIDVFDRHLYNKGSCVLWTLRYELGDAAFWGGVRRYLETNAHSTVHTRDFQRALEEVSGASLEGFFQQWVHRAGHPTVTVKLSSDHGQLSVAVQQKTEEPFTFDLGLEIVENEAARPIRLRVTEKDRTFVIDAPAGTHVRVDPGYRVLAEIRLEGPEAWLMALLEDRDPVMVVRAARSLLRKDPPRARRAVLDALAEHPEPVVRAELASVLGRRKDPEVVDRLAVRLAEEADPRARRAIAQALGVPESTTAADALLALLGEPALPTWQLEGAALVALGKTRDPRAPAVLRERLSRRSWADWVAQRAIEGLGHTRDPSVWPDLLGQTEGRCGDRTQAAAALALATLADDQGEALRREVVDRLMKMTAEAGFRAQMAAMTGLGRLRDARALGVLSQVHSTAPDGRTRRVAYEAMARIRKGRTTEEGLATLRARVEQLAAENAKLRSRLDKLVDRLSD